MVMSTSHLNQNRLLWIGGHAIDPRQIDNKDVEVIMSKKGLVPLTGDERSFVMNLANNLDNSTLALGILMDYIETNIVEDDGEVESIRERVIKMIESNENLSSRNITDIGKGLDWI